MKHPRQDKICRILIVDDDPQNIQIVANTLQNEGYQMAYAQDGRIALEKVKEIKFDLILLDVMMPEIDGLEVCKTLKSSPGKRDIPVIFLTVKDEMKDIVKGFEAGAADYLIKPFHSAELLARVRTHLTLKKTRDREKDLISKLKAALAKVKQLSVLLPICSGCKKIRDDEGYWQQLEHYLSSRSEIQFTHSFCPECIKKIYPGVSKRILKE